MQKFCFIDSAMSIVKTMKYMALTVGVLGIMLASYKMIIEQFARPGKVETVHSAKPSAPDDASEDDSVRQQKY